jgi:hypothetical protein
MTSSRYNKKITFCTGSILLSEQDYLNLKSSIETTCTFSRDLCIDGCNYHKISPCPFEAMYYEVDNREYFHVTNDARRIIWKFLSEPLKNETSIFIPL